MAERFHWGISSSMKERIIRFNWGTEREKWPKTGAFARHIHVYLSYREYPHSRVVAYSTQYTPILTIYVQHTDCTATAEG